MPDERAPAARALVVAALVACGCAPQPSPFDRIVDTTPVQLAPGVISTAAEEYRITFTPDGRTAYFARGERFFPFSRQATIYETRFRDGAWTTPKVAPFSGRHSDIDPFVSPDGRVLYFSSIRPVDGRERSDSDLWAVMRTADGWSEPFHLGDVNSEKDELYPSVDQVGALYFASDREGGHGGWDIYRAARVSVDDAGRPRFGAAENVGAPVNTEHWEFNPTITADGSELIYTGLRYPGGAGFGDLYRSRRSGGAWSARVPLDSTINTASDEFHSSLSPDGRLLFFVRRAGTQEANGDLFVTPLR